MSRLQSTPQIRWRLYGVEAINQLDAAPRIEVQYNWESAGRVGLVSGRLHFPQVTSGPAIYSFRFISLRRVNEYIGESASLSGRFYQYGRPGPSQRTNLRVSPILIEAVERTGPVELRIITTAALHLGIESTGLDLNERWARILVESLALERSDAGTALNISQVASRKAPRSIP